MYLLIHIFIPLLITEIVLVAFPNLKNNLNRLAIIIGSLLPDIVDKPLSLTFPTIFSGRGFAHAPLFWIGSMALLFVFTKKKPWVLYVSFGVGIHILLDIPYIPWLWPFIEYPAAHSSLEDWWYGLFYNSFNLWTEIIGFIGIFSILKLRKIILSRNLVDWKLLQQFLITNFQHNNIRDKAHEKLK